MKNEKWEILFDKKFEGYWRGDAVPDEIKSFIKNTITAEVERAYEKGRQSVIAEIKDCDRDISDIEKIK
jgi:hypothetical protein